MKIKVVSNRAERADELARYIRESAPGLDVSTAAHVGLGMPDVINGSRPGLMVYDGMDADGLDHIARITQSHPDIDTIIVSDLDSPAFLLKAMQSGVREVLPQSVAAPALQAAVVRLMRKRAPRRPVKMGRCWP